jgi:hypothetical protein
MSRKSKKANKGRLPAVSKAIRAAATPTATELRKRAEAPVKPDPVVRPDKASQEVITKAAKSLHKAAQKAAAEALCEDLVAKRKSPQAVGRAGLEDLSAGQLHKVAKAHGQKGHSGLKHGEVVAYLATGHIPAPEKDSTRDYGARARDCKAKGLISGPVSALRVAELKSAVAKAEAGEAVTVTRPEPNKGTAGWYQEQLRALGGAARGYGKDVTAKSKELFGKTVSALKAAEVKELAEAFGIKG